MGDSVRKQAEENLGNIDKRLFGGISTPQADHVTEAGGAWKVVAIPAGTRFIDFTLNYASHVIANATATTPFTTNDGVAYLATTPLTVVYRIPCYGCTYLHLKSATADVATMTWNAIA